MAFSERGCRKKEQGSVGESGGKKKHREGEKQGNRGTEISHK
jgi:hypothetical protein